MKLKRFAYLICAILVTALSLFPNTTADANSKIPNPFTVDWYEELGTCNDGSTIVDSEVITFDEMIYVDNNGEWVKAIDHISVNAMIYVKEKPELVLKVDPFKSMAIIYFTPEFTAIQSGSTYKLTIPGLGRVFSATGRGVYNFDDSGNYYAVWQRGNWTPKPDVVNSLCTYFGLQ
jgi:hypothetical protein